MPQEKMGMGTGVFNLMRNIGGSFGIAGVTTLLAQRAQFHQARLIEHLSYYDLQTRNALQGITSELMAKGHSGILAQKEAAGFVYSSVIKQALTMSFIDAFWLLGVVMLLMIPLVFIMRRPPRHETSGPAAH
jgi:DHA2 family multidrug resistance protein